jgi:site-specific recombinase XerD
VDGRDIQRWMTWLLDRYSSAYASNQYRALQQFFRWLAAEEDLPDPMAGLQPPKVAEKLVPVFTGGELSRLEQACAGRGIAQRRDAAIIAVFRTTGIRLSELADIRYDASDPRRSDVDLWQREITVRGKGGRPTGGSAPATNNYAPDVAVASGGPLPRRTADRAHILGLRSVTSLRPSSSGAGQLSA